MNKNRRFCLKKLRVEKIEDLFYYISEIQPVFEYKFIFIFNLEDLLQSIHYTFEPFMLSLRFNPISPFFIIKEYTILSIT